MIQMPLADCHWRLKNGANIDSITLMNVSYTPVHPDFIGAGLLAFQLFHLLLPVASVEKALDITVRSASAFLFHNDLATRK